MYFCGCQQCFSQFISIFSRQAKRSSKNARLVSAALMERIQAIITEFLYVYNCIIGIRKFQDISIKMPIVCVKRCEIYLCPLA